MKILLVNPEYPDTFWSYRHALRFIAKKALGPPLGLLTVAAMLPGSWEKRLCDLNVAPLRDEEILWADSVFIGAMSVQKESAVSVIERCKALGKTVVAGGPLFTTTPEAFPQVDHLVLNEGELTLPAFLSDLENGVPQRIYVAAPDAWADLERTPEPLWDLIDMGYYNQMSVQYSRGCPFDCEFCDVTLLNGRRPRVKDTAQFIAELESLYRRGWRGPVFVVDDNFISRKSLLKNELLPAVTGWLRKRGNPFTFNTQASIDIADDEELMRMMVEAGMRSVFIGIETPNDGSLAECSKAQNRSRDLVACVQKIQRHGLEVQAGFIMGFDSDPESIFETMIRFIQESGVITAMVGLLNALPGTKLHRRLAGENRLLSEALGDITDGSMNFVPRMERETLLKGYRKVVGSIYSPKLYYERVMRYLKGYTAVKTSTRVTAKHVGALLKSFLMLGVLGIERIQFWKLMLWTIVHKPRALEQAVTFAITGYHYRKVFE